MPKEPQGTNGATLLQPSERLKSVVLPALSDCSRYPLDQQLANILARALNDYLKWTYTFYKRTDPSRLLNTRDFGDFQQAIFVLCQEMRMMWDLADASHRQFLIKPTEPPQMVRSSTAAHSTEGTKLFVKNYDKPFLECAERAVRFWEQWVSFD